MPSDQNPIRMTIRLSPDHRAKLETIAHSQGTSMAAVIRAAVEAYDPKLLTPRMNRCGWT